MAFVQTAVPLAKSRLLAAKCSKSTCASGCRCASRAPAAMTMPAPSRPTRRAFLHLAAFVAAAASASAARAESFDLKELKDDVEELSYDAEVVDVGPDDREKNPTRIKKPQKEPEYRAEEKVLEDQDEKAFDAMVVEEEKESAILKAKFSKAKK